MNNWNVLTTYAFLEKIDHSVIDFKFSETSINCIWGELFDKVHLQIGTSKNVIQETNSII